MLLLCPPPSNLSPTWHCCCCAPPPPPPKLYLALLLLRPPSPSPQTPPGLAAVAADGACEEVLGGKAVGGRLREDGDEGRGSTFIRGVGGKSCQWVSALRGEAAGGVGGGRMEALRLGRSDLN